MDVRLDPILKYNLTPEQARAYKVQELWLEYSRKIFPNYNHGRRAYGDPRKTLLFRYCRKLVKETQTTLPEIEYSLYVRAQLYVLKAIGEKTGKMPLIGPNCLVGDQAWKRWKVWKRHFDARVKDKETLPQTPQTKIFAELEATKEFLVRSFSGVPTWEAFHEAVINKNLSRWVLLKKVSPWFLILSPWLAKLLSPEELDKLANCDLQIFRSQITPEVEERFRELFAYETV